MPGHHVSDAQHERILWAAIHLIYDRAAAVSDIAALARVSSRTFYELFDDRSDCLVTAIERGVALAGERASSAYEAGGGWVHRIRAGLLELLSFFDEEPRLAWLMIVYSAGAGPDALTVRRNVLDQLERVLDEGRGDTRAEPSPHTAEGIVGGVVSVIHTRLVRREPGALTDLVNPLTSMIVLPYLGPKAARRELSRPSAAPRVAPKCSPSPLSALNVRLTYRTMAVLAVIAAEPGLTNKAIGERAGIADPGQVSRLLARLCARGLTRNGDSGQAKGIANAWRLTHEGAEIERVIRATGPVGATGSGRRALLPLWRR